MINMTVVGLGKMGSSMAAHALKQNIKVFGLTKGPAPVQLVDQGLIDLVNVENLLHQTTSPRIILLYVPAGPAVEEYITIFEKMLTPGDIVIDGGNSYWGDSVRRHERLRKKKIHLLDMGTSGGVWGAMEGACFMVGGEKEVYESVVPLLAKLSASDAYAHVGPSGAGHLVKLIHNGIEFGMLQAIGEGMALLDKFKTKIDLDIDETLKVYQHGSVIRSWLIDLMRQQLAEREGWSKIPSFIEDTGEVNWLISDALHLEVPVPVIAQSIMELFRSRDKSHTDYKSIAMMRHGFGGHPFGERGDLKLERTNSRISEEFILSKQ
jgi:6-phosphogluconate dehydrogenase